MKQDFMVYSLSFLLFLAGMFYYGHTRQVIKERDAQHQQRCEKGYEPGYLERPCEKL